MAETLGPETPPLTTPPTTAWKERTKNLFAASVGTGTVVVLRLLAMAFDMVGTGTDDPSSVTVLTFRSEGSGVAVVCRDLEVDRASEGVGVDCPWAVLVITLLKLIDGVDWVCTDRILTLIVVIHGSGVDCP